MKNIDDLKRNIVEEVDRIKPRSIEMANHIFDNPELSQKEFKTKKYLVEELEKNGFKVKEGIGGLETSFKAEFDFNKDGQTFPWL